MTSFSRRSFLVQLGLGTVAALSSLHLRADLAKGALPRSTPEAEGIASSAILDFLKGMEETKHELHSFMMLRHGKVVAEAWWAPYAPELKHTMYSMSKSFTSTAVGFAVAEGKMKVTDKVISFFPDSLPATVSDNLAALTVKDLLSMAVGNEKEPTGVTVKEEDWVKTFLAQPIAHQPGTVFLYNSAATYMCSAIVQKVTGQKIIDYLTPRLFEPLGITGMTWEECPRGINTGGWGLSVRSEGLAKFGQLYLQKGKWNGRQILPESWIEEATTFKIQQPAKPGSKRPKETDDWQQGYCYQFWRCQHNAYRGDGAFGQFTIVMPDQDAVIVMTSETKDMQGSLDLVYQHLLPAMKNGPLPQEGKLLPAYAGHSLPLPEGSEKSALADKILGRTWKLESNALGLTSLSIAADLTVAFKAGETSHAIRHSIDGWQRGETEMPGTPPRLISGGAPKTQPKSLVAANARWKDDRTLVLTWRYIETPHRDTVTCVFGDDGKVTVTFLNSLAAMAGKTKDDRPVLSGS